MITAAQIRAARGWLNWSQEDLARSTGLHPMTISAIEQGRYPTVREHSMKLIVDAFERNGVKFSAANGQENVTGVNSRYQKPFKYEKRLPANGARTPTEQSRQPDRASR